MNINPSALLAWPLLASPVLSEPSMLLRGEALKACIDARDAECALDAMISNLADPTVQEYCKEGSAFACGFDQLIAYDLAAAAMVEAEPDRALAIFDKATAFGPTFPFDAAAAEAVATLHLLRAEACLELGQRDCFDEGVEVVSTALASGRWPSESDTEVLPDAQQRADALLSRKDAD